MIDIVDLGGRLLQLAPSSPDPTLATTLLEVIDADTLRIAETPGYRAPGELVRCQRDAADCGGVAVRTTSGATACPIDADCVAIAGRDAVSVDQPTIH